MIGKGRTAVVIQPCFFPWRGQFDLLSRGDVAVLFDTVQYVRRSWQNRNRIMTAGGPAWITVPVQTKGNYHAALKDMRIANDRKWQRKMLRTIEHSYRHYPYFVQYFEDLSALLQAEWQFITDLAQASIEWSFGRLGRERTFLRASSLEIDADEPVERLIKLCQAIGATHYLSGPRARAYIGEGRQFTEAGIELVWMDYNYRDYPQVRPHRDAPLSILDMLFNLGAETASYIWQPQ